MEGNDIDRLIADWIKGYKKGEFAHYYDLGRVFQGYGKQERDAVWAFLAELGNDYATLVFGWECLRCNLCFERLTAYLELLKGTDVLDCYEKYYILWQIMTKLFTQENIPFRVTEALYEIYSDISDAFCAQFDLEWIKERDSSFVIVTVQQFLGETHAPTKTTLDRAEVLAKEAGKNVLIVNTAEQIGGQNFGLLFVTTPKYVKSLQNVQTVEYHQRSYPYYQFGQNMPDIASAAKWFAWVKEKRPAYIVNIGGTSLLLDATAKLVPVLNINTVFSGLEKTKATVQACAKPVSKGEQKLLALLGKTAEDVIVGRFTFPRKMQQYTFTRRELGIPEYAFVLVVMGARLTAEMSSDFLEMLNSLLSDDIFLAIIGKMENYPQRASEYPVFGAHSMYYGFQTDVLCILECCDLYVNPERVGGGSSVVEAMSKGLPAVTLPFGDVSVSAGEDFCVQDYGEMARTIQRYETDSDFYEEMSMKARQRAEYMMDSSAAFLDILEQFEEIVKRKEKEIEKD